jgi:hypothetical protein
VNDPVQVRTGTPGFAGAIIDLMRALQSSFAPRSLTQRGQYLNQRINDETDQQAPGAPSAAPAGPAPRVSLGNQSPSLGNSF